MGEQVIIQHQVMSKRHFLACLIIVGQSLMLYFAVYMSVHLLSLLLSGSS